MSESLRGGSHATPASGRPAPPVDVADAEVAPIMGGAGVGGEVRVEVLGEYTVARLRVIAQKLDIPSYTRLQKAELVAAIEAIRASV